MPARKNRIRHDENTRKKIQAAQLINRLHACATGEVEMDSNQVRAATALLNKVLPDLSQVQAEVDNTHTTVSAEPLETKPEQWERDFGGSDRAH